MREEELLRLIQAAVPAEPILQAIGVLDCEATQDSIIKLPYDTDVLEIVHHFGQDAPAVVRWFFHPAGRMKDAGMLFNNESFSLEPRVVNKYGYAFIMSEKHFDKMLKTFSFNSIFDIRVKNLNKGPANG